MSAAFFFAAGWSSLSSRLSEPLSTSFQSPTRIAPEVAVPPWPKFLRGCLRYREALDRELPNAPSADYEYEPSGEGLSAAAEHGRQ